jgi:hypothetical protein
MDRKYLYVVGQELTLRLNVTTMIPEIPSFEAYTW